LRPKADGKEAHFYALVSDDTVERRFAAARQRFLTEQGYRYRIVRAEPDGTAEATGAIEVAEQRAEPQRAHLRCSTPNAGVVISLEAYARRRQGREGSGGR
ncbi:MAG TPA: hypothetical protein VIL95_01165, partial [Bacillota bacterium]